MVAWKIADFDPCENVNKTTQIMPNLNINLILKSQIVLSPLWGGLRGMNSEIRSTNYRFEQNIWKSKLVCNKKYTVIFPIKK